jgi:hypothetical protein
VRKPAGRTIPLSLPRRWIGDLVAFSRRVPTVAVERTLHVPDLVKARRNAAQPPGWCPLVTRAFGLVSARQPELRRSYLEFPFPRLYEHPFSVASLVINREFQGEPAVFPGLMQAPETLSLREIEARLKHFTTGPMEEIGCYRRLIRTTKLPRPLRRFLWWYGLCTTGKQKSALFGTFSVNSVASMRMEVSQFLTPITTSLYFDLPGAGKLKVHLAVDHRVFDGIIMSRALGQLERVLNTEMAEEVAAL